MGETPMILFQRDQFAFAGVRDKLGGLESEMTKSQVAKSQSNPKDQASKPREELAFS